jgi:hypothetical protein
MPALLGRAARLVFEADETVVAVGRERVEDGGEVDLALVWLGAGRDGGDLDMADHVGVALDAADEIALHDLHVIGVEEELHVRLADLGDQLGDVVGARDEVARLVAGVQRLEEERDPVRRDRAGGGAQVSHVCPMGFVAGRVIDDPGHHVDHRGAERTGVIGRLPEARLEIGLATGQPGQAPVAGRDVAGRRVETGHPHARSIEPLLEGFDRQVVGKVALDLVETGGAGRVDALQEGRSANRKAMFAVKAGMGTSGFRRHAT